MDAAIRARRPQTIVVIGGTAAVSPVAYMQLAGYRLGRGQTQKFESFYEVVTDVALAVGSPPERAAKASVATAR